MRKQLVMEIKLATNEDATIINSIVENTINEIYPIYLSQANINFFLDLHKKENIIKDIENENVWAFQYNGITFATATCIGNLVKRLFILPSFQSNGYGSAIMSFFEDKISENYNSIIVEATVSSINFYIKRNYYTIKNVQMDIGNNKILYFERLQKDLTKEG
jgi:GNAT superfamily N-acetyltransferase